MDTGAGANVFVARQPIFDRRQHVIAYELLFRSSLHNVFQNNDGNQATSKVILDSYLIIGMESMTGGKSAFINFNSEMLEEGYASMLPRDQVVIEVLESVLPTESLLAACKELKDAGYRIALDDFAYHEDLEPLVELAGIIKVDLRATGVEERRWMIERFSERGIKMLAEKVESRQEFEQAMDMGYDLFQGFFFSKPTIVSGRDVPGFKLNYLQMIQEINRPSLDFDRIQEVIRREVSVSYKLLRYINSVAFGIRHEIHSIKQALVMLGEREVKKWASLVAMAGMGEDKPSELVRAATIRAKFCEMLAVAVGMKDRQSDFFLMGMFSMIDAIMDQPLEKVLKTIPLAEDIKSALLGHDNKLRTVFDIVSAYDRADWDVVAERATTLKMDEAKIPEYYAAAVEWSNSVFEGLMDKAKT